MMTELRVDDPEHWHQRAEDIRRTTTSIRDPEARARLLRIADGYEIRGRKTSRSMRRRCEQKVASEQGKKTRKYKVW
jgi:hypothetical protein